MGISFGREICGSLETAESREWLVTNGIGGYGSGTLSGLLTRRYHGLLIAALHPPLGRTLMLAKLDESLCYDQQDYLIHTNRWSSGAVSPSGYEYLESFELEGTIPVWRFACADALLEKRVWMQQGANTTYIHYSLSRASSPLKLTLRALVNYRDYHSDTHENAWQMEVTPVQWGLCAQIRSETGSDIASLTASLYLLSQTATVAPAYTWINDFELAAERERGLQDCESHLHVATLEVTLQAGESCTVVASTESAPCLEGTAAVGQRQAHEQSLLAQWRNRTQNSAQNSLQNHLQRAPDWIQQLVLAADQFIVNRPTANQPDGKTVLAGYHWFSDWGRDTMISLPGLTLATGRPAIARSILQTFAKSVDQGMLPNRFPDAGDQPEYNTVDATLWYFEAIRAYFAATQDRDLLCDLFPVLVEIVDWHRRGTRYGIQLQPDGLLSAGESGVQLTWMDAKVEDWVVTPRIGKPVEINALWYSALLTMAEIARQIGQPAQQYQEMARLTQVSFQRFWNAEQGCCYDVLDGPSGNDSKVRPNQIFAVLLPQADPTFQSALLTESQQRMVLETCKRRLLTSHGLRSLSPQDSEYQGRYGGSQRQRDGAYHQGTVWGWLIGPFVQAHLKVYGNRAEARQYLAPMAHHLANAGLGSLSEIFDGDPPITPRGCIAQAWTVAAVLNAWVATEPLDSV